MTVRRIGGKHALLDDGNRMCKFSIAQILPYEVDKPNHDLKILLSGSEEFHELPYIRYKFPLCTLVSLPFVWRNKILPL